MSSNKFAKKIRYSLRFLPDELYIQLNYFAHFKKFADLRNPKTYNEKLNWLKLHDRNPLYTELVDKYAVKEYIDRKIGGGYTIPTLGIWNSFDEIDFDALPDQFVLKCTHDSEGLVIVQDRTRFNKSKARVKITNALRQNFYHIGREYPYKDVQPRIIAEPYMVDNRYGELRDYKFFCFNGVPRVMFIATGRSVDNVKFDYYDLNFTHMDIKQKYDNSDEKIERPKSFDEMLELARKLSKEFPHVRVDFYEVNGKVYFGELTFYHFSGFMPFQPNEWDVIFGNWLDIKGLLKKEK